ncbi:hypothetical protein C8R43DRAFT_954875 [Mycena crocata]|nr:hypothetical protein C8R43DRAFT_954875 [Mycena crocata]
MKRRKFRTRTKKASEDRTRHFFKDHDGDYSNPSNSYSSLEGTIGSADSIEEGSVALGLGVAICVEAKKWLFGLALQIKQPPSSQRWRRRRHLQFCCSSPLLERQKWVNRIWEAVHRPTADSSAASSSAGDADESASVSGSNKSSKMARSESIRTILSVDSAASASSNGSRSTVFVPPIADIPDIGSGDESTTSSSGYLGVPREPIVRAGRAPSHRLEQGPGRGRGRRRVDTRARSRRLGLVPARTRPIRARIHPTHTPTLRQAPGPEHTRVTSPAPRRRPTHTSDFTRSQTDTTTRTQTTGTGVRRRPSLVSSHHTGTVDDSVISGGEYVYPGDPRVIAGPRRGMGARRGSMGEIDEGYRLSASSGGSDDVFLSADSRSVHSGSSGTSGSGSGNTRGSMHYPPLPPSSISSVSTERYPPLPPSTVSSEYYPPLPPSSVSASQSSPSVSDVSSLSFSTSSSTLPHLEPLTPYQNSEESSDAATPMSLAFSSASSASVSAPSPIESEAPSSYYEEPSALSKSMSETSLTSSSNLTPLSRALSSLCSWGRASSGTHESSILVPSPSVGSVALHDAPDTSGETSFLRPTESFSSFDRLSTIPRSKPPPLIAPANDGVALPPTTRKIPAIHTPAVAGRAPALVLAIRRPTCSSEMDLLVLGVTPSSVLSLPLFAFAPFQLPLASSPNG